MHTLTLQLNFDENEHGIPFVHGAPAVDGVLLDPKGRYAFNLGHWLSLRNTTWPHAWVFNCACCGSPECAGIEDPTRLVVGEQTVEWQVPASLRPELNAAFSGDGPLDFVFDRAAFAAEMQRAMACIEAESLRRGRRIEFDLWERRVPRPDLSLEQELDEYLQSYLDQVRKYDWYERVWAGFHGVELEIDLPKGYVHTISLCHMADLMAGLPRLEWAEQPVAYIEHTLAPALKAGLASVVEQAHAMGWPAVVEGGCQADRSPEDVAFGVYAYEREWPSVHFSLTNHAERCPAEPERVQWYEEHFFNAWPARQTIFHGDWICRLSGGFTKRANSVNALRPGALASPGLLGNAEALYARHGLPAVFRITPLADPGADRLLEVAGYVQFDESLVMSKRGQLQLSHEQYPLVEIDSEPTQGWLDGFAAATGVAGRHLATHHAMVSAIAIPAAFATVREGGRAIGFGLAVVESGQMSFYDIVIAPEHRQRGYGRMLLLALMQWGHSMGARYACLQVRGQNEAAQRLYANLDFEEVYRYHYRVPATYA